MIRTDVDPGARGLFEQNEDPFGLCTEYLGCESCEMVMDEAEEEAAVAESRVRWTRKIQQKSENRFPPPISCLAGGRSKFLKKERRDGRLVLTEIKIERPKVFCASRENGRLRLEMVTSEAKPETEMEQETEDEDEDGAEGEERKKLEWGRSERFRRCQEVNGEPWRHQRFVTTA